MYNDLYYTYMIYMIMYIVYVIVCIYIWYRVVDYN